MNPWSKQDFLLFEQGQSEAWFQVCIGFLIRKIYQWPYWCGGSLGLEEFDRLALSESSQTRSSCFQTAMKVGWVVTLLIVDRLV